MSVRSVANNFINSLGMEVTVFRFVSIPLDDYNEPTLEGATYSQETIKAFVQYVDSESEEGKEAVNAPKKIVLTCFEGVAPRILEGGNSDVVSFDGSFFRVVSSKKLPKMGFQEGLVEVECVEEFDFAV